MNSFRIAYRSILERGVASTLTMLSMALGVGLVVAVLSIHGVVAASFRNNSNLGYNMIVGAKGGEEQLTLNTVFYLSKPVENIPYHYYLEFLRKEQRDAELQNSFALRSHELHAETAELASAASGFGGAALLGLAALREAEQNVAAKRVPLAIGQTQVELGLGRNGKFGSMSQTIKPEQPGFAIPLCLGDYVGRFRVVGTTPGFFSEQMVETEVGFNGETPIIERTPRYSCAAGRPLVHKSPEHGYFEAVLGAQVARELKRLVLHVAVEGSSTVRDQAAKLLADFPGVYAVESAGDELLINWQIGVEEDFDSWSQRLLSDVHEQGGTGFAIKSIRREKFDLKVGDRISPAHGSPKGHLHQRMFTVVGILAPSGTPNDRAVFINMEGFYLMEDHAKPLEDEAVGGAAEEPSSSSAVESFDDPAPLPVENREVTAILVRANDIRYADGMRNAVNEGPYAQAVYPVAVIVRMFEIFVRPIQQLLLLLTVMICIVSGISILVSIYNSMSERRHEIAVMRALGASRGHILFIVLYESILLALGGGALGFFGGHFLIFFLAPYIEDQTGVQMGMFQWDPKLADLLALFSSEFNPDTASLFYRTPAEVVLLPMLLVIAVLVGIWPAISAYRTDVAKSLGK
jgi:ABC-type antimicrobial peptide transport system permease subunit